MSVRFVSNPHLYTCFKCFHFIHSVCSVIHFWIITLYSGPDSNRHGRFCPRDFKSLVATITPPEQIISTMSKNYISNIKKKNNIKKPEQFFISFGSLNILKLILYNPSKSEHKFKGCTLYPLPLFNGLVLSDNMLFMFIIS